MAGLFEYFFIFSWAYGQNNKNYILYDNIIYISCTYSRLGKLLAEGTPNDLIEEYEKPALEDVFLHLCMQDGDLETTRVREQRKSRQPIIKGKQILADIYRKYSM